MERPPGFEIRAVAMEAGVTRIYNEAEWRDALVLVARGEIELESVGGESCRFGRGSILCLVGLRLRALRSRGREPTVLVAVSRRCASDLTHRAGRKPRRGRTRRGSPG